ncbi:hypothetical protein [Devosia sp.]|uniref:hypothetical protein n=1 Tax=Devosia sp. TaxID=1871048 RepID=UPI002AFE2DED|nr:hypothetical protein [Devosia sp.]
MSGGASAPIGQVGVPPRAADLDLFKTLLVCGMIAAHCIQLLVFRPSLPAAIVSETVNFITFSGFLFAFGLGLGLSRSGPKSWALRLKPVAMLLLATWSSEIAFILLVDKKPLLPELWNVLTLSRLYGWSEFLASFAVLYAVIALARPWLIALASRWYLLVPAVILCLLATNIVVSLDIPLLATLVGTENFASFPLLPYLPWFLIGIFFARNRTYPALLDWALTCLATGACVFFLIQTGNGPERFPPAALWIAGPALALLVYFSFTRWLARSVPLPLVLLATGRHVLAALLVSNLVIFSLRFLFGFSLGKGWAPLALIIAIIAATTLWAALLDQRRPVLRTAP